MCKISDFTEQIVSEIPFRKTQETEDFRRLSPEHPNGEWLPSCVEVWNQGYWKCYTLLTTHLLAQLQMEPPL